MVKYLTSRNEQKLACFFTLCLIYFIVPTVLVIHNIQKVKIVKEVEESRFQLSPTEFGGIGKITIDWELNKSPQSFPIPKIFHQSWKTKALPDRFEKWHATCKENFKDFQFHIWDDEENRNLTAKYFPSFLNIYDSFPEGIFRADFVRYLYMYVFGGIYADLDLECLRPMDSYFNKFGPGHAFIGTMKTTIGGQGHEWPNAWLASSPGQPVWLEMLKVVLRRASENPGFKNQHAEYHTGPAALHEAIVRFQYMSGNKLVLLDPIYIYPFSWDLNDASEKNLCDAFSKNFNPDQCKELYKGVPYAITYWTHIRDSNS